MRIRITLMRIRIPACHFNADPNKGSEPWKVLKYAHIPYILGCHLQIDADTDPDHTFQFDADPDWQHC